MINIAICDDDTFFIDYIEKVIVEVNGSDKEVLTIEDRIMANERIDFQRMREISEMIFRKENMSLIVIGPTKGITENKLRELL
ncbi:hypothetical protein [Eubacterium ventriosum]|uniref:hypothetical protein n=1 Tax=Eubacterium ventriosum TaxID=39496 RepID=UPI001C00A06F|nr:hypothetical protein [Eubacterium ventriosum]